MTTTFSLERMDGGSETLELASSEYVTDNSGRVVAFAEYDHTENETDYYVVYQLRMSNYDHRGWLKRGFEALKDVTRPARWGELGMKAGDHFGGRSGGPRRAAQAGRMGYLAGFCLGAIWPVLREQFLDHYDPNQRPELCYVDGAGNEVFHGPLVIR